MSNRPKRLEVKRNINNRFLHQTNLVCMSDKACPALKGNLCLTKKLLFLTRSYGYTYKCRRQDVAERGKDAEVKRGANAGGPLFLFLFRARACFERFKKELSCKFISKNNSKVLLFYFLLEFTGVFKFLFKKSKIRFFLFNSCSPVKLCPAFSK